MKNRYSFKTYHILIAITCLLLSIGVYQKNCSKSSFTQSVILNKDNQRLENRLGDSSFIVDGNHILLNEETRRSLSIQTAQASLESMSNQLELTGIVIPDPDKTEMIGSRLPGRVIKIFKKEGDSIQKGELLISIDSPEVAKLRSQYISLRSKWEVALRNSQRIAELAKSKLASDQERRNAESEAKILESEMNSMRENLRLQGISPDSSGSIIGLRAGLTGRVLERLVAPGEPISENTNLIRIGDLSYVWFKISIFEKDLAKIRVGQKVSVELNAYPNELFQGVLEHIGQSIEMSSGSIPSRIHIPNKNGKLKLGLIGKAFINSSESQDNGVSSSSEKFQAWSSEDSSILEIDGVRGVFLVHSDQEYEWNPIQIRGSKQGIVYWTDSKENEENLKVYVREGGYQLKALYLKSRFQEED